MGTYIGQRLMLGGVTLLLVTVIVFVLLRVVVPLVYADAVDLMAGEYGRNDPQLMAQLRHDYGLSGSLAGQYVKWLGQIAHGDLGRSLFSHRSVVQEMGNRLEVSVELGVIGLLSGLLFAVPMGIAAAVWQDRWPDYTFRTGAIVGHSVPGFWIAIMIITFGSLWFHWAPPLHFAYIQDDPIAHFKIMLLPALLVGLTPSAGLVRIVRTQMLEVLRQDYIRTAHAKGLHPNVVIFKHALRNALIPVVTVVGLSLPGLIAGTVLYEEIFTLPGMGKYLVDSTANLDYPVIMSTVLIFAVLIVLSNLLVDLSYSWLDPRIRY